MNKHTSDTHALLVKNIGWLTDMEKVYLSCPTTAKKQELIRTVFDNSLWYEDRIYRTPYLIPELSHNELIMKEKGLLVINKKGENLTTLPSGGGEGIASAVLRPCSADPNGGAYKPFPLNLQPSSGRLHFLFSASGPDKPGPSATNKKPAVKLRVQ
ncbi:MAG TPA: hypothetical protein VGM30_03550 [Puia sp.]